MPCQRLPGETRLDFGPRDAVELLIARFSLAAGHTDWLGYHTLGSEFDTGLCVDSGGGGPVQAHCPADSERATARRATDA
jgi:hypothetical protein